MTLTLDLYIFLKASILCGPMSLWWMFQKMLMFLLKLRKFWVLEGGIRSLCYKYIEEVKIFLKTAGSYLLLFQSSSNEKHVIHKGK